MRQNLGFKVNLCKVMHIMMFRAGGGSDSECGFASSLIRGDTYDAHFEGWVGG